MTRAAAPLAVMVLAAAVRVVRAMRFRPGRAGGCAVPTLLLVPVEFNLAGRG